MQSCGRGLLQLFQSELQRSEPCVTRHKTATDKALALIATGVTGVTAQIWMIVKRDKNYAY